MQVKTLIRRVKNDVQSPLPASAPLLLLPSSAAPLSARGVLLPSCAAFREVLADCEPACLLGHQLCVQHVAQPDVPQDVLLRISRRLHYFLQDSTSSMAEAAMFWFGIRAQAQGLQKILTSLWNAVEEIG